MSHSKDFHFQGRADLNKGATTGWRGYYGPGYPIWRQNISQSDNMPVPDYQACGFHVEDDLDIYGMRMQIRQSSSSDNLDWKLHLAAVKIEEGTRNVTTRFLYSDATTRSYLDTDVHLLDISIDDFLYPNEIVTLMFQRPSTSGSNRYYLFVSSGIILTR